MGAAAAALAQIQSVGEDTAGAWGGSSTAAAAAAGGGGCHLGMLLQLLHLFMVIIW